MAVSLEGGVGPGRPRASLSLVPVGRSTPQSLPVQALGHPGPPSSRSKLGGLSGGRRRQRVSVPAGALPVLPGDSTRLLDGGLSQSGHLSDL